MIEKINKSIFDELCVIEANAPYPKVSKEIERYKEIVKLFKEQGHIQTDGRAWFFTELEVERIYNIAVVGIAVDSGKTYIRK